MVKNVNLMSKVITPCIIAIILLFPSISCSFPISLENYGYDKVLLMGAIQYPMKLSKVPVLRVYYGGNKIKCEAHDDNKKLTFEFTEGRQQSQFYILITEQIEFVTENNVVLYLKVPKGASYKAYVAERIRDFHHKEKNMASDFHASPRLAQIGDAYRWLIREWRLGENRRLPDNTIIVCDDPEHIAEVAGESAGSDATTAFELPKIVMHSNLLEMVGSEEKLQEQADLLRLAAIDSDTIHAWREDIHESVNNKAKTIVALTA